VADPTTHWEGCVREHPACLDALVARLRALLAQATPPPWEWVGSKRIESTHTEAWRHKSGGEVLVASDDGKPYGLHSATLEAHETDRAFLVAAVNALAALLDALDALRAERVVEPPGSGITDAPLTLRGIRRDGAQVIVEVGHEAEQLLEERDALRVAYDTVVTQLGEAWLEYGCLLNGRRRDEVERAHERGECAENCPHDHEPSEPERGVPCPAGCASRMVPDYVDTHLTMCPAVQAQLRADLARVTAQRDAAVAVVEAARPALGALEAMVAMLRNDDFSMCNSAVVVEAMTRLRAALAAATPKKETR